MKEMGRIYWCHSVGTLGLSLAAIFVPIFLLKNGLSFAQILIFLLLQQVFAGLLQYPASRILGYISPHYMLAIGNVCSAIFFGLLNTLNSRHWSLALVAFVWALDRSVYWTAFHYIFGTARKHEQGGRQVAGINALVMIATTIAPALGGIVASLFGISYTYVAAILLLGVALLPVLSSASVVPTVKLQMSRHNIWDMRRDAIANMFEGMVISSEVSIWPLLIFTVVSSYSGVGILSSVIVFSSVILTLYVGRKEETRGEKHYIKEGLATYSFTSLGRAIAQTSSQIFGLNLLGGIGRSLYVTPFMNRYYKNSDGDFRLGYITVMETSFAIGAAIYIAALLGLAAVLPMNVVLSSGLVIAALSVLGVRYIRS